MNKYTKIMGSFNERCYAKKHAICCIIACELIKYIKQPKHSTILWLKKCFHIKYKILIACDFLEGLSFFSLHRVYSGILGFIVKELL